MNNIYRDEIRNCFLEIREINDFVSSNFGDTKNKYLQLYLLMRCSGVTEYVFKHMVFDKITSGQSSWIVSFFENEILKNPTNPKYECICEVLSKIDSTWVSSFKSQFSKNDRHIQLLDSLVKNRNRFAHGTLTGVPSISEIKDYFISACFILHRLDNALV